MTTYQTRSEEFGRVWFHAPAATDTYSGYVWIETEAGCASRERRQICKGGFFRGQTITATSGELKSTAQSWLRQRRKAQREIRSMIFNAFA
jgi:hypothetical protein